MFSDYNWLHQFSRIPFCKVLVTVWMPFRASSIAALSFKLAKPPLTQMVSKRRESEVLILKKTRIGRNFSEKTTR